MTLLLLIACGDTEPTTLPDETGQPPAADTADTAQTAPAVPLEVSAVDVVMSEAIGTVAVVTFAATGEGEGVVVFGEQGEDASYQVAASEQDDGTWRAVLVGVPASSTGWLQVGLGTQLDEAVHTYTTGAAPEWLVTERTGAAGVEGFYALAVMGEGRGAVIVTTEGEPVWWTTAPPEAASILSRVQLSPDHQTVWLNAFDLGPGKTDPNGMLVGVALDGTSQQIRSLPRSHHDFLIHADGTVAAPMVDVRESGGQTVVGDAIVEVAEDGTEAVVWSAWDSIPYSGGAGSEWWIMLNHLQWVPEAEDYVASLKNITAIARVDSATGSPDWIISDDPTLATLTPDDSFLHQHGLHVPDEDHLMVFDNDGGDFSRVITMHIDEADGRAETVSIHSGDVTSVIMGDVTMVGEQTLICYSSHARIDELDAAGALVSQLAFPRMTNVGYITHLAAIGAQAARR